MKSLSYSLLLISAFAPINLAFAQRAPMDPTHTVGVQSCAECHEEIVESWQTSAHAKSFDYLAKSESAKKIASVLGITPASITTNASCVRCHFTQETYGVAPQTTAAVSCESCHGEADLWIDEHNRKSLPRPERVANAIKHGMNHPGSVASVSQSCYECHVIDDEQLVNQAGHPAISREFEILSWYSGEAKHNFLVNKPGKKVKSHSENLQQIPQARKRMIFLTGKLQHLSQSLRAMASAKDAPVDKEGNFIMLSNGNYTFGVQHATEAARLIQEIRDIQAKVGISEYAKALAVSSSLTFTTGQQRELIDASQQIKKLANEFSNNHNGNNFSAIDTTLEQLKPRFSAKLAAK